MPQQIQCPNCPQKLRVPDNLMGKKVKCPKCAHVFTAKLAEEGEDAQYAFREEAVPEAKKKAMNYDEDVDDGGPKGPEDEDEDEARPRKRKRRHNTDALAAVRGPAIGLTVACVLQMLPAILFLLCYIYLLIFGIPDPVRQHLAKQPGGVPPQLETRMTWVVGIIFWVVVLALATIVMMGAARMRRLESYGFAVTAAILAIIPCSSCFLVGIPFGIYALVVLNKPEVKEFFR